jgi:hypothetical protein
MWMIVVLCAATNSGCSLYDNLGNLNSYSYNLYSSKQECNRDGKAAVKNWTQRKGGGTYTYFCQNTSSPSPPP